MVHGQTLFPAPSAGHVPVSRSCGFLRRFHGSTQLVSDRPQVGSPSEKLHFVISPSATLLASRSSSVNMRIMDGDMLAMSSSTRCLGTHAEIRSRAAIISLSPLRKHRKDAIWKEIFCFHTMRAQEGMAYDRCSGLRLLLLPPKLPECSIFMLFGGYFCRHPKLPECFVFLRFATLCRRFRHGDCTHGQLA